MRWTSEWFKANDSRQAGGRIGFLLGGLLLFWSAQLSGNENPVKSAGPDSRAAKPPLRVLVVSIPDRKLAVTQDGRVLKVYSVAVGATVSPSPTGRLRVISKVVNPTYYHRGKVIAPGKSNPLGDRWIGLSETGYGIHGTNAPSSIGHAASHGCFRMRKQDVEDLFDLVRVGDVVEVHGTRDQQVAEIFPDRHLPTDDGRLKANPSAPALQSSIANGQSSISKADAQVEGD